MERMLGQLRPSVLARCPRAPCAARARGAESSPSGSAALGVREEVLELGRSEGLAEAVSLPLLAAQGEQPLALRRALDALGGDGDAEGARERRDGAHDRLVGRVAVERAQQGAVDLQLVDRQAEQGGEARVLRSPTIACRTSSEAPP